MLKQNHLRKRLTLNDFIQEDRGQPEQSSQAQDLETGPNWRTVDDKTKAHLLIFSAQKSSLRVTTPTLCLLGWAGIVGSNPALGLNSSQPPNQNCGDDNNGELLPNDFEQQPNHAEADDKPEQEHRDFGLRLSLRRTFSYGYRFKIGWHDLPPPRMT